MKPAQGIQRVGETQLGSPEDFPLSRARCSSFRVKSVARSTSFARSSIEADDRLPVPVFEKSGSDL